MVAHWLVESKVHSIFTYKWPKLEIWLNIFLLLYYFSSTKIYCCSFIVVLQRLFSVVFVPVRKDTVYPNFAYWENCEFYPTFAYTETLVF